MPVTWSKPAAKRFTSWSWSRLSAYRQCPLKARLAYLDKVPEPAKPDDHPMVRGDRIHKLADAYVKGAGTVKVPEELSAFASTLKELRKMRKKDPEMVVAEDTWAFRSDWTSTVYNDWTGCWLRVKLDVAKVDGTTVTPIDWKTGKYSPQWNVDDYLEQLDLYALTGLLTYADVGPELRVTPVLMFTDAGVRHPAPVTYEPSMVPALKKKWEKAAKPMMNDTTFAAKPNRFCSSCWYRKGNAERKDGGTVCKFN